MPSSAALRAALVALVFTGQALADPPRGPAANDVPRGALDTLDALKLETGAAFAVLTYAGIRDWKWGTAFFRFHSEDWFGLDSGSGGQDKLGHAFATYGMSQALYLRLRNQYIGKAPVTVYPPILSWLLMLYIEVFDGYSVDHGFSYEDLIMNTSGAALSYLKNAAPAFGRGVDFRLEYLPSARARGLHFLLDYEGQKCLLALRPSGLDALGRSPLKFFELYLGYFARGFERRTALEERRQVLFLGIGVDLQAVLSSQMGSPDDYPGSALDTASELLRTIQLPYGYPTEPLWKRQRRR